MKIDYGATISVLRNAGLIGTADTVVVCQEAASFSAGFLFGAIGAAAAQANCGHFILSANESEIRVFNIDKKTGLYLDSWSKIPKDDIDKVSASGLGGKTIAIKTLSAGMLKYVSRKKWKGYDQAEQLERMVELFKTKFQKE